MKAFTMKLLRQFGIFVILTACISPIDIRINNTGGQIIISGQVSSIEDRTTISIGRTASGRLPEPKEGAQVILFDMYDNYYGSFHEYKPGEYILLGFSGVPGMGYKVQVTLDDGRIYESAIEVMPEYAPAVSVTHQFNERVAADLDGDNVSQRFIDLFASTEIPEEWESPYFFWSVDEVYLLSPTDFPDPFGSIPPPCFVYQKIATNKRALYNGSVVNSREIQNLLVHERKVDRTFLERHYLTTYQSSITQKAYEYWSKVNTLAFSRGSIFDTPPAQVKGNFHNIANDDEIVWGYFQATHETFDRFFLLPTDFPYTLLFPTESCTFDGTRWDYPPYCLNCLSAPNSSYTRPDWF